MWETIWHNHIDKCKSRTRPVVSRSLLHTKKALKYFINPFVVSNMIISFLKKDTYKYYRYGRDLFEPKEFASEAPYWHIFYDDLKTDFISNIWIRSFFILQVYLWQAMKSTFVRFYILTALNMYCSTQMLFLPIFNAEYIDFV